MTAKQLQNRLKKSSVFFATFSLWQDGRRMPTNGSVEPFRDFLLRYKVKRFILLDQPVPGSETVLPRYERYGQGRLHPTIIRASWIFYMLIPLLRLVNFNSTQVIFKIRDALSVILWGITDIATYDYFVGLESVNALCGVFLKKLGKVKRVIYYVSDYSPNRYPNRIFNSVYLWLDRQAVQLSDYVWDVSQAMQPARIQAGLDAKFSYKVLHVPNGVFNDQLSRPKGSADKYACCFMGTLGPENGPDVAIKALSIVQKKFPKASLHVIGGSTTAFGWLSKVARKYKVADRVKHYGFVPRSVDMTQIMNKCGIGLAPYRSIAGSARWYGDAGKIRAYCAAGLAVISSPVPPLGQYVKQRGAAIVTDDTPKAFAQSIIDVLSDKKAYQRLRTNAFALAQKNTWNREFYSAFARIQQYENKKN
jgi:glycosyltransferase involved in cell wall biosynthesis